MANIIQILQSKWAIQAKNVSKFSVFSMNGVDIPIEDLCRLLRIENEAGMVPPQNRYNTQTQAGGVAAHQVG